MQAQSASLKERIWIDIHLQTRLRRQSERGFPYAHISREINIELGPDEETPEPASAQHADRRGRGAHHTVS